MILILALPFIVLALYLFKQWERIRTLQKQCDALGKTCAEQAEKIEKLETDISASTKKATDVSHLSKNKEKALSNRITEAANRIAKLQNDQDQLQAKYTRDLRAAQDELQGLREVRDELQKLVESQAAELTTAREFTFMTDQVAAADVTRTVQDLNSTIYQTAMQLISIEAPTPSTTAASTESLAEARYQSINAIGDRLLHLAATTGQEDESYPILAFQSAIASICASAISSWVFGRGYEPQHEVLNLTYGHIWASGMRISPINNCFD
jgi:DNA repair exonuclease SbcCD ATPase subunit